MKYLSFAIPCYNSAAYMEHAVESILKGGEDVEIIIVNDGSKDGTAQYITSGFFLFSKYFLTCLPKQ